MTTCYVLQVRVADGGGRGYRFKGAEGRVSWPIEAGYGLGAVGAWNLLLRLGIRPLWLDEKEQTRKSLRKDDILFAVIDGEPVEDVESLLAEWLSLGGRVFGAGSWSGWPKLLGLHKATWVSVGYPYAALACVETGLPPQLAAPPGWSYMKGGTPSGGDVQVSGHLVAVRGERQTPARAIMETLPDAPAKMQRENLVYWNANPFSAFQAWLQGQEEIGPWLGWRHRLFWLDEYAAWVGERLRKEGVTLQPVLPESLLGTTVVLRHDLDYSRDTSYLELEEAAGVPATHAILRDRNASFWLRRLASSPGQEAALHYNTGRRAWLACLMARLGGRSSPTWQASFRDVAGKGLQRQVNWARYHGVGVATLHRHLLYMVYPEWIDALDWVFKKEPHVLGASSLFRAMVLRWGTSRVDGVAGTVGDFPDVQFPYWFPCRLSHAGRHGQPLAGWESASIMEPETALVERMLNYSVAGIPSRVLTLNFHPAHARGRVFDPAGSLLSFRHVLQVLRESKVRIMTLREVYAELNKWIACENASDEKHI